MLLIGKEAPEFLSNAVLDGKEIHQDCSLSALRKKQAAILFFYPKNFTFVCPTELWQFQENLAEFEKRDVKVIGCSTDTEETHLAWLRTPKNQGGIQGITYPLIADVSKTISCNYGVLAGAWYTLDDKVQITFRGHPIAYRGTFFIDKDGIVRHQSINDFPLGRNIEELLRIVDMWQHHQQHGEVCPANWNIGQEAMKPTQEGVKKYFS